MLKIRSGNFEKKILKLALKNIIFEILKLDSGISRFFMKDSILQSGNTHSGQI